jgi:5'-deoxynucleotidase YfbR-like HD superfamily hydrolase
MNYDDVYTDSRFGGLVRRYHTWPVLREQNNAEHSWQVARLFHLLFDVNSAAPAKIYHYIRYHDSGELLSGDVPYTAKKDRTFLRDELRRVEKAGLERQGIQLPDLTASELDAVKVCDLVEMFEYGCEELRRGNSYAIPYIRQTMDHALGMAANLHSEDFERISEHMRKTRRGLEL